MVTISTPLIRRSAVACSLAALAAGGAYYYNRLALSVFDNATEENNWLRAARPELGFPDRLVIPFLDDPEITNRVGPKAIRRLASLPLLVGSVEGARLAVGTANEISTGCGVVDSSSDIPECGDAASKERTREIEDGLAASGIGEDYYLSISGRNLALLEKIPFKISVCNLYPVTAITTLSISYDPSENLEDRVVRRNLSPGACTNLISEKLRHAPVITANANASGVDVPQAGAIKISTGAEKAWQATLRLSDDNPDLTWRVLDPNLCHTSPEAACNGEVVTNPAGYTRMLAASLENERTYSVMGPYMMGFGTVKRGRRDELGVLVEKVNRDGPAAAAELKPGDLIVEIGDIPTFSFADIRTAISLHGKAYGRSRPLSFKVLRDGEVLEGALTLGYDKKYWDARGFNDFYASIRGFVDTGSIGLVRWAWCWVIVPILDLEGPRGQGCTERWLLESDVLMTLYGNAYQGGSLVGAFISPLRILAPESAGAKLFGSARIGKLARGAVLELTEQSIYEINMARPEEAVGDIVTNIQDSAPLAAAVGVVASLK